MMNLYEAKRTLIIFGLFGFGVTYEYSVVPVMEPELPPSK